LTKEVVEEGGSLDCKRIGFKFRGRIGEGEGPLAGTEVVG
jgi:hypothetical protein